ncbi:MAG: signal peptidase II [Bacteroides sp.]|nr:MAG: signal peptidase II [Bacteroides sp.]
MIGKNNNIFFILSLIIVLIDQLSKFFIKKYINLNDCIFYLNGFLALYHVENDGIIYGFKIPLYNGKILLSIIKAIIIIHLYYIFLIKNNFCSNKSLLYGITLMISGALSNTIDSWFHDIIYYNGYIMNGNVTDMIYLPFMNNYYLPFINGKFFFNAIFNIADINILLGCMIIILFGYKIKVKNFLY